MQLHRVQRNCKKHSPAFSSSHFSFSRSSSNFWPSGEASGRKWLEGIKKKDKKQNSKHKTSKK